MPLFFGAPSRARSAVTGAVPVHVVVAGGQNSAVLVLDFSFAGVIDCLQWPARADLAPLAARVHTP